MSKGTKILICIWLPIYTALLGFTLNNTLPIKGDESFYIASSIEMLESGEYLVPDFYGELRFQKPPLTYWLTLLGYKIFGINLWSGRLFFLLLACGLLILVYKFALLILPSTEFAILPVLLLSSSTLFIEFARVSMTDMPLAFFTTLALYCFVRALQYPTRMKRYYFYAYISTSLAFLSKGPLAFFPCLAIAIYLLYRRPDNYKKHFYQLFHPYNLAVFALLALTWYLYVYISYTEEFIKQFGRESSDSLFSNMKNIFENLIFYLRILGTYIFPFALISVYVYIKRRNKIPSKLLPVIYFICVAFTFLVIFLSRHKARYMLVIFPALTLVIGYIVYNSNFRKIAVSIAVGVTGIQLAIFLIYPLIGGNPLKEITHYWQDNIGPNLGTYKLSRKTTSILAALSHGSVGRDDETCRYLVMDVKYLDHFKNPIILKRATQISKVRIEKGKIVKKYRTYVLIDKGI